MHNIKIRQFSEFLNVYLEFCVTHVTLKTAFFNLAPNTNDAESPDFVFSVNFH